MMVPACLPLLLILLVPPMLLGTEGTPGPGTASPGAASTAVQPVPPPILAWAPQAFWGRRLGPHGCPELRPARAVPQYLLDLHRHRHRSRATPSLGGGWLPFPGGRAGKANTVRAFQHRGGQQRGPEDGGAAGWSHVLFNISGLPDEEELLALELRFSRQEMGAQGSRISLYHAPDPSEVAGGQHWLLEHRVVAQDQPRWQRFDVTAAVQVGKRQLGFLVEVVHRNSSSLRDLHLRARRSPREAEGRWAPERPLLVTYSHDQRSKALSAWGKRSRGQATSRDGRAGRRSPRPRSKRKSPKTKKGPAWCHRHPVCGLQGHGVG